MTRPFERGPFEQLPELPRIAHPFTRVRGEDITVESVPFGKLRVHVRRHGSGPPLLLVHGLMTTSYSWRYVLEPLGERFTVYAPDLPGCGRTEHTPDRPHSARALATFLGELQRELGIEGCRAIGNSLGGYVCMQRALEEPRGFERLMVVHAPAFPELRLYALHAALAVPGARSLLAWRIRRDPERFAHANVHYFDETLKSLEEAREYALRTDEAIACFAQYLSDALDPSEMGRFVRTLSDRGGLETKLSLVYADQDPMVPPRIGKKLHALVPKADFHVLEGTSHFAHVDSPDRILRLASSFFV